MTTELLKSTMDKQQWKYIITSSGDLHSAWDGHGFDFMRQGPNHEILIVRGRWEARPSISLHQQILDLLNGWNRDRFFPKAYIVDFPEDGNSRVVTEVVIDCEHGITEEQLKLHILSGITTSLKLFEQLNETFPGIQETD